MAMFSSLDKFRMLSTHEGVCQFSSLILAMSKSSDALLDHIADYLQFISNAQSLRFTLNVR